MKALGDNRPVFFFFFQLCASHFTPDLTEAFCHPRRGKDGWGRREGGGWKCRPQRQWRNRCWAAGTWQRLRARKR